MEGAEFVQMNGIKMLIEGHKEACINLIHFSGNQAGTYSREGRTEDFNSWCLRAVELEITLRRLGLLPK